MTDVFPDTKRGFQDLNDFIEMLPLWFPNLEAKGVQLNYRSPSRNWYAEIYEPHAERLLAQRKAMTRKQWRELVSSRCIADVETWVRIISPCKSKPSHSHISQRQARIAKFEHDAEISRWLDDSGLTETQKRIESYVSSLSLFLLL